MRIDFYKPVKRYLADPQALLALLAAKCFEQGTPALWLVASQQAAEELDQYLWERPEDSFLPHQICGDPDDAECPLLIVPPGVRTRPRGVIFNHRVEAVPIDVERVIELIPPDASGTSSARARWKDYASRGHEPSLVEV